MTMVAPYTIGALAGFGRRRRAMMRAYPTMMGAFTDPGGGGVPHQSPHVFHRRRRGMGQSFIQDVKSLFSPTPGGGYVVTSTNGDGSQNVNYVDETGSPQTITVPAGQDVASTVASQLPSTITYDASGLATATADTLASPFANIPAWVWWAVGVGGVLLLLGFSGAGKLIPRMNPIHRHRRSRRRTRSRR